MPVVTVSSLPWLTAEPNGSPIARVAGRHVLGLDGRRRAVGGSSVAQPGARLRPAALGIWIARHGRAARKMKVPFGPFLALGGIVGLFWGTWILDAYLRLM